MASCGGPGPALGDHQRVRAAAVGAEDERPQRWLLGGLDQRRRRPVAEDRPQRAIGRVDVFRVGLRGDQEDPPGRPAANQAVGQRQTIDEPRTAQVEIQGPDRGRQPQPLLHQAGGRRQRIVGRLRAEEEEIDRAAVDLMLGEELLRRRHAQIGGAFLRGGDVPGADPRLRVDQVHVPTGILGLQVRIVLDLLRQMNRDRANGRVWHRHPLTKCVLDATI